MHEPNIKETAFSCPHCGAYTTQYWYNGYVEAIKDNANKIPFIPNSEDYNK